MDSFLACSSIIDWQTPDVACLAETLRSKCADRVGLIKAAFEFVRDEIRHTADFGLQTVTCSASDVIRHGTGLCYAKSHLLAALLRASGIPAGFCYQRLSIDGQGAPYCLHAFNAVHLDGFGWYRMDARGNKNGIETVFSPPVENLAFSPSQPGEATCNEIWSEPLRCVVQSLMKYDTCVELYRDLPDIDVRELSHCKG